MKKVNVFFIGLILVFLSVGVNAQDQSSTDFFAGDWEVVIVGTPNGDAVLTLTLERVDGKFKGLFASEMGDLEVDSVEEKDATITLFFFLGGYDLSMYLEKVDDDNIKGNVVDQFDVTGKRVVK